MITNHFSRGGFGWAASICAVVVAFTSASCTSYDDSIGSTLMPEYTVEHLESYSFDMEMNTVSADVSADAANGARSTVSYNNVFVNSRYGYLGSIPNAAFGGTACEYLTQFYCPPGFKFQNKVLSGRVDSTFIVLTYNGYVGRSASPLQVTAYKLKKPLDFHRYSISDVSEYVDLSEDNVIGRTSYTAAIGSSSAGLGVKDLKIRLAPQVGQDIYERTLKGDAVFANQASFNSYFPGVYLKTTAGDGSVLSVARTALVMYYDVPDTLVRKSTGAKDSVVMRPTADMLSHTMEVPQVSRFANEDVERLLSIDSKYAYIKSPAGVFAEFTIPTTKIAAALANAKEGFVRELNSVPFVITGERPEESTFALAPPPNLILMPRDSVVSFFEKELTEADAPYTTYVSNKTSNESTTYSFGNIVQLIRKHIAEKPSEDLHVVLVPILRSQNSSSSNYSSAGAPVSISNLILPSAMKISKEGQNRSLRVVISERKQGAPF